jgi:hypothetical protein
LGVFLLYTSHFKLPPGHRWDWLYKQSQFARRDANDKCFLKWSYGEAYMQQASAKQSRFACGRHGAGAGTTAGIHCVKQTQFARYRPEKVRLQVLPAPETNVQNEPNSAVEVPLVSYES